MVLKILVETMIYFEILFVIILSCATRNTSFLLTIAQPWTCCIFYRNFSYFASDICILHNKFALNMQLHHSELFPK
jgi:hypothetical protein